MNAPKHSRATQNAKGKAASPRAKKGADSGERSAAEGERIAKRIARAGVCSRREAEALIASGAVSINGEVLTSPARNVTADDRITVRGKALPEAETTRLWLYYKPVGLITSHRDPEGRPTVFAALPADMPRVVSIGRLDINSEGLLLLTNDGALARHLELPATGWVRRYRARVHGRPDMAALAALAKGCTVDGVRYGPMQVTPEKAEGTLSASNHWLNVAISEGKNREVRRVLESVGLKVNRLIRVAYGPFQLGKMERGEIKSVPAKVLAAQLGTRWEQG